MALLPVVLLALVTTACGAAPPPTAPSGVDLLEVPTPSPDPVDFVEGVDHSWFPLEPGERLEYDVTGQPGVATWEVTAVAGEEVRGVPVTGRKVVRRTPQGQVVGEETSWLAQDREGNVWLLGRDVRRADGSERRWRAGPDGPGAGLVVPADPRTGDGWVVQEAPGFPRVLARVADTAASVTLGAGTRDDVLVLELEVPAEGRSLQWRLLPGVGPVELVDPAAGTTVRLGGAPA